MRRVVVLGMSGSGKTTFARELSQKLKVPHIELDAIHWQADWTSTPIEQMWPMVEQLTACDGWTIDGNYTALRELIWRRADTIIWLDFPLTVVFTRLLRRTLVRCVTKQELWNGNRERLLTQFFSRDSLLLWGLTQWRKQRSRYGKLLRHPEYSRKQIVRLRSPAQAHRWLRLISHPPVS
jgi:adenylate kinase family enzyme